MNVTRVRTEGGSHIEPPLDPAWSELTRLAWHAAVVTHDTGLRIAIHPGRYKVNGESVPGFYNLVVGSSSSGPHTFRSAWDYLNGVDTGARQTRRRPTA
ncbi:hypothetical protein [Streptomyces flavidovirens]|uniref:hypothetical protein n=1 Tax=Streptomyces flavidovirens TaxID=67298 RepID=UPI0036C3E61A